MSYRIDYNPENRKKYPMKKTKTTSWLIYTLVVIAVIFTAQKACKNEAIKTVLLPGDPEITSSAISTMIDDVKSGEPIKDAVTAFCLEIIHNA